MNKRNHYYETTWLLIALATAACLQVELASATTRTVTTLNDSGANSLRALISISASGDTINFSVSGTITLTGELAIGRDLTIIGPRAGLTISGNGSSRVFNIVDGTVTISDLKLVQGHAGADGGGIFNGGTLTLSNCTISASSADYGGGIYNGYTLSINNCTVSDNYSIEGGGGIYNAGVLAATNSTVWSNSANGFSGGDGGGINNIGALTVVNCTFAGNYSGHAGGGIYQSDSSGYTFIRNTIVGANGGYPGPQVYGRMGRDVTYSLGHNLIAETDGSIGWMSSDLTGTVASPLNPLLGPLADNGGPTLTMAFLPGSAAIDAGDDAVTSAIARDQRGRVRKSGARVDIGAYEVNPAPIVTNTNDNGAGSLRDAVLLAASGEPVNFASNVTGTIALTSGELAFSKNLNINGPGARVLTVSGNSASRVFHITSGASQISNLRIANGHASGGGGGIALDGGSLTLSACAISDCYAQGVDVVSQGGGAISAVGAANLTITASTLSSNTTPYAGGGLYLFNAPTVSLINSTVSGNRTLDGELGDGGGGIFVGNSSKLNVTNSTIANNSTVVQGGGLYKGLSGTVALRNSLVASNSAGGLGPDCKGTFVSAGYNLIGNSSGSTGFGSAGDQLNVNALIGPLQDNGGPTFTHALLTDSAAIDRGVGVGLATDQRGMGRSYDFSSVGNASGGNGSDIGAFELYPPMLSIARVGGNVVISWPSYYTGSRLQFRSSLSPAINWTDVPDSPALVGSQFVVTNAVQTGNKSYRLRTP